MKFTCYLRDGKRALAFVFDDGLIDLTDGLQSIAAKIEIPSPESILTLSESEKTVLHEAYQTIRKQFSLTRIPLDKVQLLPLLLTQHNNIFFVGRNYRTVREDMNKATNKDIQELERPAFFIKTNRSVIPSGHDILACYDDTQKLDYEGEIGIVIGKEGKDISYEDAASYIYGLTICNDVSARDTMKAYYQMFKGKSMDTFAPIGPCIVSIDEFQDLNHICITTHVNGALRQNGCTDDLIFDFATIVSTLSRGMTLYPGDIISTGTPSGIGAAMEPPSFLKEGDIIEIQVPEIGTLKNKVHFYHR